MNSPELASAGMALGWLSFGLHLAAFVVYGLRARKGQSKPNFATWSIWVLATGLNCASYFLMSDDWVKALQPLAGAAACFTIFVMALKNGQFELPGTAERVMLLISVTAVIIWFVYRDASYANMVLQSAFVVSFIPTLRQIWRKPQDESALPWFMWGGAYLLLILTVAVRWQGNALELVYPVNSFFWHTLAGVLALRRNGKE